MFSGEPTPGAQCGGPVPGVDAELPAAVEGAIAAEDRVTEDSHSEEQRLLREGDLSDAEHARAVAGGWAYWVRESDSEASAPRESDLPTFWDWHVSDGDGPYPDEVAEYGVAGPHVGAANVHAAAALRLGEPGATSSAGGDRLGTRSSMPARSLEPRTVTEPVLGAAEVVPCGASGARRRRVRLRRKTRAAEAGRCDQGERARGCGKKNS